MKSPAFLNAYREAYAQLLEIGEQHQETGVLQRKTLKAAAENLVQSLEENENFVPAYVLLVAVFLCINNQPLARKYLTLAEEIAPEFPALLALKQHMESPVETASSIVKTKVIAEAIKTVEKMETGTKQEKTRPLNSIQRLFKPLLPLIGSPDDLCQAISVTFSTPLSQEDCFDIYAAMTAQSEGTLKETMLSLQQSLGSLDPAFARSPLRFAQQLAGSPAGVLRQLHLLLAAFKTRYPTQESLSQQFESSGNLVAQQALFNIMHAPNWEQPEAQINALVPLLIALDPEFTSAKNVSFETLLERLGS